MTQTFQSTSASVSCARHVDQPASTTCARCGNFMCGECGAGGQETRCPACRERAKDGGPFPLSRADWRFDALVSLCWRMFQREWLLLSLGMLLWAVAGPVLSLIVSVVGGGLGFVVGETGAGLHILLAFPFILATQGVVQLGVHRVSQDVLRGESATFQDFLGQWKKVLSFFVLGVLGFLLTLAVALYASFVGGLLPMFAILSASLRSAGLAWLGMLLGGGLGIVVVGLLVYVVLRLSFLLVMATLELAGNDAAGPLEALGNARRITRGQVRWFVLFCLISVPLLLLGILMLGIGVLPALALCHLLLVGLHQTLRNGMDLDRGGRDTLGVSPSAS